MVKYSEVTIGKNSLRVYFPQKDIEGSIDKSMVNGYENTIEVEIDRWKIVEHETVKAFIEPYKVYYLYRFYSDSEIPDKLILRKVK